MKADANAVSLRGVRVLVVDDDPDNRELAMFLLSEAGATVEGAESAAEGYELLRQWRPDVLVSDIGMPEEDGLSFMRRVRALSEAEGGRVPAIALTAFVTEEDRQRGLAAGYMAYIRKPADVPTLLSTVARLASAEQGPG